MSDNARFRSKCGNEAIDVQQVQKREIIEDNEIKFQLKPNFNFSYKLLATSGIPLIILILLIMREMILVLEHPIILAIMLAITMIYIVIKMIFDKKQYEVLEYNFYNTKVEYKDGFLNREEKELKYKYIREITMSQNILERAFSIGKIKIYTNLVV